MHSCYRPQRSCGLGNIFTPVCHSVHRGVSASDTPLPGRPSHQGDPPEGGTPLPRRPLPPGKETPRQGDPLPRKPPRRRPLRKETPLEGGTTPQEGGTPWKETPRKEAPPKEAPPARDTPQEGGTPQAHTQGGN